MTTHRRSLLAALTVVLAIGGCKSTASGSSQGPEQSPDTRSVNPLANRDGLKPGLAPISSPGDQSQARDLIGKLTIAATGSKAGYEREKFGTAWTDGATGTPLADNGCDTRNDVLARDGQSLAYTAGSKCVLSSMTLYNPYKSETIQWTKAKASAIQIDHVVPLSYAWQMGASRWPENQRVQLANDPLNLLAVDGSDNASKGDSGPSEWLPPNTGIHCAYAVRFAEVALKYKLDVAKEDKTKMLDLCHG